MQPPLAPLPRCPEHQVPGFARGPPGSTGFKAHLGSIIRSGLGAASAAAPAKPGPDWGRRRRREGRESASGKEAGSGRLPLPALHSGRSGQLSLGAPYDLGETPLRDLPKARCTGLPIPSARGRSSGRSRGAGLGRRGALRARGTQQPAHGCPLERPGALLAGKKGAGSPGSSGRCQLELAVGWVRARGRLLWGPFPPGQERCLWGPSATTRGGGAPMPGPEAGYPGCLMFGCGSRFPALRPWAEAAEIPQAAPRSGHGGPSQQPAVAPPTPASSLARQTRRTPPLQSDSPACAPGTRRSSAPLPQFPPAAGPWPKRPTHPQSDLGRLGPPPHRDPQPRRV